MATLHKDLCTFMTSHYVFLTSNVSDISCKENQNAHFMSKERPFLKIVLFTRYAYIYIYIYGTARQAKDDNVTAHMCLACWISNVTDTHNV
jgi:hypothetical protein